MTSDSVQPAKGEDTERPRGFLHVGWLVLQTWLVGYVTGGCLLVLALSRTGHPDYADSLMVLAIGAFPVGSLIALGLLRALWKRAVSHEAEVRRLVTWGACVGGLLSLINLFVYPAVLILSHSAGLEYRDGFDVLRLFAGLTASGATAGAWLGWQVARVFDPLLGRLPRFSLRTLVILVLAWGALLALFLSPRGS
ncbi:MAG: hypothetical protein M5U26_16150 [Planctomycetota bacterium]|nr:hypothetical protein [Planctomycetota bacterium]